MTTASATADCTIMVSFAQRDSDSTSVGLNAEVLRRTEVWPTEEHQGRPVLLSGGEPVDARSGRLKDRLLGPWVSVGDGELVGGAVMIGCLGRRRSRYRPRTGWRSADVPRQLLSRRAASWCGDVVR
jgi:hypothetical protein